MQFLNDLRKARLAALDDGENAAPLLTCFERLGFHLQRPRTPIGLGDYRAKLIAIANRSRISDAIARDACQVTSADLFDSVVRSRNEEMHVGISARRLVDHSVRFAIMLEAGLMADLKLVKHFMVAEPICAQSWQTIAHVRQALLLHQFSYLPYEAAKGKWKLISDYAVATYLRSAADVGEALTRSVGDVVPNQLLRTDDAPTIGPNENVSALLRVPPEMLPWLVVEGREQTLRGIVTAFDLL